MPSPYPGELQAILALEDELAVASAQVLTVQEELGEAIALVQGLCGLVELVRRQLPGLDVNHRYRDACAWLAARATKEGLHVDQT